LDVKSNVFSSRASRSTASSSSIVSVSSSSIATFAPARARVVSRVERRRCARVGNPDVGGAPFVLPGLAAPGFVDLNSASIVVAEGGRRALRGGMATRARE
jgi:hypothetical protein